MGDQPTGSVLFDTSTLADLFARCYELQEYSERLSAEAARMRIHLRALKRRSAALITVFESHLAVNYSQYPRRQWPLCPRCGSRETLKAEILRGDMFQCPTCQYGWSTG